MSVCWQSLMSSSFSSSFPVSHRTSQSLLLPSSLLPHHCSFSCSSSTSGRTVFCSLTGFQEMSAEPLQTKKEAFQQFAQVKERVEGRNGQEDDDGGGEVGISKIHVPRQKHVPVSKSELRDAIVSVMFQPHDQDEVDQFLLLSSCLDAILHAEHKCILEEMRSDYYVTQSVENDESTIQNSAGSEDQVMTNDKESEEISNGIYKIEQDRPLVFNYGLDLRSLLNYLEKDSSRYSYDRSRVAVATRFQRAFMKLLSDAQFEELSARDLMLTSALNTDYLLTLPIYVDWERAYKSNAIIFRRGYATERQKGLLIVEKIDYLQSRLLRGVFSAMSKPLGKLGSWINELSKDAIHKLEEHPWTKRSRNWLKELSAFQKSFNNESISDYQLEADQLSDKDLPIWLAAQRAVARYEGILSQVGPRGRLLRKLLMWIGLISPMPEVPVEPESDTAVAESHLRPISLSRISLSDIWRPATRKHCGNNFWKIFKTSISIFLSQSILQEPAFQELILLYTKEMDEANQEQGPVVPSLQLKIYERIPIPDLPVIFPHKKLSFRIIDTVRLDAATILGLLAYFINYKFEDVLSSPSAIFLDVVAVTALVIYGTRVALGYKQTWDRYQLLVNKTLYEKTLASGFGAVHFLLDASEQQQYKEAILAYAVLLKADKPQVTCKQSLRDKCERFIYDAFKVKVEMGIDKAINTLIRLRLVTETGMDKRNRLQAVPCAKACAVLKEQWNNLLD